MNTTVDTAHVKHCGCSELAEEVLEGSGAQNYCPPYQLYDQQGLSAQQLTPLSLLLHL